MRVVARRPTTFHHRFTGAVPDGEVSVTAVDLAGTEVVSASGLQVAAKGVVSVDVPADVLPGPDLLTTEWDAGAGWVEQDTVEVAGGWLVNPALLGEHDRAQLTAPAATRSFAAHVEDRIEEFCGVAFVPRAATATVRGDGSRQVVLPDVEARQLRSVDVDGTSFDPASWTVRREGVVLAPWRLRSGSRVQVVYEHGLDRPPADVADAALDAAVQLAAEDRNEHNPDRVDFAEGASWLVATADPGRGRLFGIPKIDAVLVQHRRRPLVAS